MSKMKQSSVLLWLGINLAAAATICYVVLAVHYHPKQTPTRVQPAADTSSSHVRDGHHRRVNLREKLTSHKHRVISQLRQSLLQQKVSSKHFTLNQARFFGTKKLKDLSPSVLLENLQNSLEKSHFHTVTSSTNVFRQEKHLLRNPQSFQQRYGSCAIVSSAGALLDSDLGNFIDGHDYVVRFNNAPTMGFEVDVGNKTSLRILNSQILSKPQFNFFNSSLYRNVSLLVWDPSKYNATLEQWACSPDFPFVDAFFSRRRHLQDEDLHLMDPRGLWDLWDYLSLHSPLPIPPNPPSSGFIGLALTLSFCDYVDMIEFVPSLRMTKRCHYYDTHEDVGCTLGDWHPLAAEKLLVLSLNPADDHAIFVNGYVRIPGFPSQLQQE
ncbi:beta-galactoside alpha-2,6-sialyltransferase 2 [Daphnia magna]|uniref:beta-galactoside alpha-(2,6)-sialyltransferase n=1 Tax=Daphnia magna TaxID=35525 RepID=A0ABQ9Z5U5_9CRUS|nr:beta-galactoside alpha-2,6-sialyltransferase 2 [Daphnia magna]KAK4008271.1 hypothetical protein OUZ56_013417 [Daphnia magna]